MQRDTHQIINSCYPFHGTLGVVESGHFHFLIFILPYSYIFSKSTYSVVITKTKTPKRRENKWIIAVWKKSMWFWYISLEMSKEVWESLKHPVLRGELSTRQQTLKLKVQFYFPPWNIYIVSVGLPTAPCFLINLIPSLPPFCFLWWLLPHPQFRSQTTTIPVSLCSGSPALAHPNNMSAFLPGLCFRGSYQLLWFHAPRLLVSLWTPGIY